MKTILLFLSLFSSLTIVAQSPSQTWYFGKFGGLKFTNSVPQPIIGKLDTWEGCAVYSDPTTGDPLLYTDGKKLMYGNGSIVTGGDTLKSGISSTQCAIFVPDPANAKRVYLFTAPDLTSPLSTQPKGYYTHISLENPTPTILACNVLLVDEISEKICATQHCADNSYWVLFHHKTQSKIYAYKVTSSGIATNPVISTYNNLYNYYTVGAMKISPDGSKLALTSEADGFAYLQAVVLFDFNLQTGIASNSRFIAKGKCFGNYGLAFSPDSKKLYTSGAIDKPQSSESALFQFDLEAGTEAGIAGSMWTLKLGSRKLFGMQLGPDGKIYVVADRPSQLDAINKPNAIGDKIDYTINVLNQSNRTVLGLPSMIDYGIGKNNDTLFACPKSGVRIGSNPMQGYSYNWNPTNGLSNPSASNPIALPNAPTNYTLTITNPFGCQTQQSFHVGLYPGFTLSYEYPQAICKGGKVQFKVSGATTYKWSPSYGLSSTTIPNPIATPDSTTTYTLVASNGTCNDTLQLKVVVASFPIADAGLDKVTCPGGSVEIGTNPVPGFTYQWTPEVNVSAPSSSKTLAYPQGPNSRFILAVTNETGCKSYDTVIVNTANVLKAITSPDTTICRGDVAKLKVSGGSNYRWYPGTGLSDSLSPTPLASPEVNTKYMIVVTSGQCIDTAYITVNVVQGAIANAGKNQSTCPKESIELGTLPVGSTRYEWNPPLYLNNSAIANPICTPDSSITYYLKVTNSTGCVSYDTVDITVAKALTINLVSDTSVCYGKSIALNATGGRTYAWYPSNGINDTTISNPVFTPNKTTMYYVIATNGNCTGIDSVLIRVNPLPILEVDSNITICRGESVTLNAKGVTTYRWFPTSGLSDSTKAMIIAKPDKTTTYYVEGNNGACSVIDSIIVIVNPIPRITIPGDTSICENDIITLRVNGADSYEWKNDSSILSIVGNTIQAKPSVSTKYYVRGSSLQCSSEYDSIIVTVKPKEKLLISVDSIVCAGNSVIFRFDSVNTISLSPKYPIQYVSSHTVIFVPTNSGKVLITGEKNGCLYTDSAWVTVIPTPTLEITSDTTICKGDNIILTAKGANSYTWKTIAQYDSLSPNSIMLNTVDTSSIVYVSGLNGNCIALDTITISVADPIKKLFTLSATSKYIPGTDADLTLLYPSGFPKATVSIQYDGSSSTVNKPKSLSTGITYSQMISGTNEFSVVVENPSALGGEIVFPVTGYLPPDGRKLNYYSLNVSDFNGICTKADTIGTVIEYNLPICTWNIRGVSQSNTPYTLSLENDIIKVQSGLDDSFNVKIYSVNGQIITDKSFTCSKGESYIIEVPQNLVNGLYFIEAHSSIWTSILPYVLFR